MTMSPGSFPRPKLDKYGYKRPMKMNIIPSSIKIFVILHALTLSLFMKRSFYSEKISQ